VLPHPPPSARIPPHRGKDRGEAAFDRVLHSFPCCGDHSKNRRGRPREWVLRARPQSNRGQLCQHSSIIAAARFELSPAAEPEVECAVDRSDNTCPGAAPLSDTVNPRYGEIAAVVIGTTIGTFF